MNEKLFYIIYGLGEKNKTFGKLAVIFTEASYYIFFTVFGIGALYVIMNKLSYLPRYLLVSAFGLVFNTLLRKLFKRPRPFVRLETENKIGHKGSYSFPSNHSASAMVITMAVISLDKIGFLLIPVAVITGLSRITAGVHYPADVAVGWAVGLAIGYFGYFSGLI